LTLPKNNDGFRLPISKYREILFGNVKYIPGSISKFPNKVIVAVAIWKITVLILFDKIPLDIA